MIQRVTEQPRRRPALGRRSAGGVLLAVALVLCGGGVASGVIGGRATRVTEAPWSVVVYKWTSLSSGLASPLCTGVIISRWKIVTAANCLMPSESSVRASAPIWFLIEAGVSNFRHPLASDHPQWREVKAVWTMRGYIAESKTTLLNFGVAAAHDLAVLKLSRPLELSGDDARAAHLPRALFPLRGKRILTAGFGAEKSTGNNPNGTLNEAPKPTVAQGCFGKGLLCVGMKTATCSADDGAGLIVAGPHPTVIGILTGDTHCSTTRKATYIAFYTSLTRSSARRFIKTGK